MKPVLFFVLVFISACSDRKTSQTGNSVNLKDTAEAKRPVSFPGNTAGEDSFTNFHNAEIVEYCVLLPAGWQEDYDAAPVKAKHVFRKGKDKDYSITVQGLLRSDTFVSLEQYYQNTYTEEEEAGGKIIEVKQLLKDKNCFYAKGYWNNSYYKNRFVEVTWLKPDETVTYKVDLPVADTALWYSQLSRLVNYNTGCK